MAKCDVTGLEQHNRFAGAWLVAGVAAVALQLYGLYRPAGPATPAWFPGADKLLHLVGFAVPVFLVLTAVDRLGRGGRRSERWTLGLFAVHAAVSEWVQHAFYPDRRGDPYDLLADLVGVAGGWAGFRLAWSRVRR